MAETIKGFRDYAGETAQKRQKIKEILVETFKDYGFEPAETPIIEYENFVKSGSERDEIISDIFKLKDKGKRELALRYEFTFQLKRLAKNQKLPYKRFQIGEVFRDEPVSSNRVRQITQCDADIISSTTKDEAEILNITKEIFNKLGIKIKILINNRKLLNEILEANNVKNKEVVIREIDKLDKLPELEVRKNLKKYGAEKIINELKKPEPYFKKFKAYNEIQELKKFCAYYNIKFDFVPTLARGLAYYNGTIFEIKTAGIKETISGGGSYMINNIQSTGISFGLDRITNLAKIETEGVKIVVICLGQEKKAIALCKKLRDKDISVILMYGKPSKAINYANSKDIPYVAFLGEKEAKASKVNLRYMKAGKQSLVGETELIKVLQRKRVN